MPNYITRVELNGPPNSGVYEDVHEAMSKAGFERFIRGVSGAWWALPDATYVGWSNIDDEFELLNRLSAIIGHHWPDHSVMVIRYASTAWRGLDRLA